MNEATSLNETNCLTDHELAKIVARQYLLFQILHSGAELTLSDLATQTAKDRGNLSKLIKTLENKGILETKEVARARGRPLKYIRLNRQISKVISSIQDAVRPTPKPKYNPETIDLCLDVMEKNTLDEKTRILYADSLHRTFGNMPQKILNEHTRLRKTLEDTVRNPGTNGEIENRKRSLLTSTLPRLIMTQSTRDWVLNQVYPSALNILEDKTKPANIRSWAISLLEDIALRCPDHGKAIKTTLREMYFTETFKQTDRIAEELKNSILETHCQDATSTRELADYLMDRATSPKKPEKEKAILLLNEIVKYLPRHDSIT